MTNIGNNDTWTGPDGTPTAPAGDDRYDNKLHPRVRGVCPSCGSDTLFVGSKGYLTCSLIGCKDPGAAHDLLSRHRSARERELEAAVEKLTHHVRTMLATADDGECYDSLRINTAHWEVLEELNTAAEAALAGRKEQPMDDADKKRIIEATADWENGMRQREPATDSPPTDAGEQVKELRYVASVESPYDLQDVPRKCLNDAAATIEQLEGERVELHTIMRTDGLGLSLTEAAKNAMEIIKDFRRSDIKLTGELKEAQSQLDAAVKVIEEMLNHFNTGRVCSIGATKNVIECRANTDTVKRWNDFLAGREASPR